MIQAYNSTSNTIHNIYVLLGSQLPCLGFSASLSKSLSSLGILLSKVYLLFSLPIINWIRLNNGNREIINGLTLLSFSKYIFTQHLQHVISPRVTDMLNSNIPYSY